MIACIILGAGRSSRFGGNAKQLAEFDGKPLLQRAIDTASSSFADYVILVVGANSSTILERIQPGRAQVVFNKDYKSGIASSIRAGLSDLPEDCGAAIIMVGDQPFLSADHLNEMIRRFRGELGRKPVVALAYRGQPRNPVLVPSEYFPAIESLMGDIGAREIVRNAAYLQLIEVDDAKVFADIDTKDSLSDLSQEDS